MEALLGSGTSIAFDLEGADSDHMAIPPAPTIAKAEAASELAELYWMALARDVNFLDYESDTTIAAAGNEPQILNAFCRWRFRKCVRRTRPIALGTRRSPAPA